MPYTIVTPHAYNYKGWTIRHEHRACYGYPWIAWKDGPMLESYGGYLESLDQARHNARWGIDTHEAAQRADVVRTAEP